MIECRRCAGYGRVPSKPVKVFGGGIMGGWEACPRCDGSGKVERFNPFLAVFLALVALYFVWQFTR